MRTRAADRVLPRVAAERRRIGIVTFAFLVAVWPRAPRAAEPIGRPYDGPLAAEVPAETETSSEPGDPPAPVIEPADPRTQPSIPTPATDDRIRRTITVPPVSEELPKVVGSVVVVGERDLEAREYDDVHRVLQTVPGVYVRNEDGFGLRPNIGMRGANPERAAKLTLMEDGISLAPAPYSAPAIFHFPLTTRMVAIEIVKGPSSIRFGPRTIAGAIDLRTREIPDRHTLVADVAGGRFGYAKGHAFYGTTYKGFGVLVEAAHLQSNGFKKIDGGGDSGFRANDTMLKLAYTSRSDREPTHRIQLKGGFANEHTAETYLGLTLDDFERTPYRRYAASQKDAIELWRTLAELEYTVGTERLSLQTRGYRHDADRTWHRLDRFRDGPGINAALNDPDSMVNRPFVDVLRGDADSTTPGQSLVFRNNQWRTWSQGAQSTLRWRAAWKRVTQDFEASAHVHNDAIRRHTYEDGYVMTSGQMLRDDTDRVDALRNRGETTAGAFHVWDTATFLDRLTLSGGLRVEVIAMNFRDPVAGTTGKRIDVPVSPAFGVLVQATRWLGIFAGVHRGFSPVAPGQPKSVKLERSVNYEAGLRVIHRGLAGELTGWFNDYRNLNGTCTFGPDCGGGDDFMQFNAGKVSIGGVESMVRYRHTFSRAAIHIDIGATYSFTDTRFRNSFHSDFNQWGDVQAGYELPYVPKHVLGGVAGVGGRIWDVSIRPHYQSAMRDVAGMGPIPTAARVDGFYLVDATAEVRVLERVQLYLQLGNLTGNAYMVSRRPFGIRPGAPLTAIVGVKLKVLP